MFFIRLAQLALQPGRQKSRPPVKLSKLSIVGVSVDINFDTGPFGSA